MALITGERSIKSLISELTLTFLYTLDPNWFDHCPYQKTRNWLTGLLGLPLFTHVMAKTPKSDD